MHFHEKFVFNFADVSIGSRNGLMTKKQQAFTGWSSSGCIYASPSLKSNTLRCRYNAVNFRQNIHPIAGPSGRGVGCLLWVQPLIDILPQFLPWCAQYHVILDRVIAALNCMFMMAQRAQIFMSIKVCSVHRHQVSKQMEHEFNAHSIIIRGNSKPTFNKKKQD